ncbi:O-antigen ligase family protein [Parenemella sanctibonifatiensis]|nr:O-antigen ligase family protein [Parenemella sanctibonifatiensis]
MVLLWCVIEWTIRRPRPAIRLQDGLWWYLFFLCIVIGTWIGIQLTPHATGVAGLLTWAYFAFVFLTIVAALRACTRDYLELLLTRVGSWGAIFFSFLLTWSILVSRSLFGLSLWYSGSRFSGGGANPHYVALVAVVCASINLRTAVRASTLRSRVWAGLLMLASLVAGAATLSTTLAAAIALTGLVMLLCYMLHARNVGLLWLVMLIAAVVAVINVGWVLDTAVKVVEGDANGLGRIDIWASYTQTFALSPVFGLGPGTHGMGGTIEYHNAFIEIAAMSGLLGLLVFLILWGRVFLAALRTDLWLTAPVLVGLMYGVGGFSVRRLVFWGVLGIIAALVQSARAEESSTEKALAVHPTAAVTPRP